MPKGVELIDMRKVYKRIGALLPSPIRNGFEEQVKYSGILIEPNEFIGFLFFYGIALGFILSYLVTVFIDFSMLYSFPLLGVLLITLFYLLMYLIGEGKARFVEKVLPDALQLLASNIKVGLTIEKALLATARPEFGPLADEFRQASKKILAGTRSDIAIKDISKNIKSRKLDKTIWLMLQGINSGGEMASLLLQLSNDLKTEEGIESETKASIAVYALMIYFVAMAGGPALLGVATSIVKIIVVNIGVFPAVKTTGLVALSQASVQQPAIGTVAKAAISYDFVSMIASILIVINAVFSSLILGILNTGNEKNGIKLIPVILVVSLVVYWIAGRLLDGIFGGLTV